MLALTLLLALDARAGALVVHGGDPAAAVAQVSADAKVPAADLRAADLSELVHGQHPVLAGTGAVLPCDGPQTTNADLEALARVAEGSVTFMEYATAEQQVDDALSAMGCLAEPVDPDIAARVLFVRGVAAWFSDDEAGARAAFRQAHQMKPGLAWDRRYPPDPAPVFTEALVELAGARTGVLRTVPGTPDAEVYIDGQRVEGTPRVTSGDHLVQARADGRITSIRVRIDEPSDAVLLVPEAVSGSAVGWVVDPIRRPDLSAVLASVLGEGTEVYVAWGESTWYRVVGQGVWQPLVEPEPQPETWKPAWWLVTPGAVAVVGGGVLTGVSVERGFAVKRDYDEQNGPPTQIDDLNDLSADYAAWRDRERAGWAITGAGLVIVGAGLVVPLVDERLAVGPMGGRPGVVLHVGPR